MKTISKVRVYGIEESFAASKYPMSVNVDECTSEMTETIKNIGSCEKGSGLRQQKERHPCKMDNAGRWRRI